MKTTNLLEPPSYKLFRAFFCCCEATSKDASFAIKVKSLDTNVRGLRGFFSKKSLKATLSLKPFDVGAVTCIS